VRSIAFNDLEGISVCEPKEMALAGGDRLQLKANAKMANGKQLANGEIVTVKQIAADGQIELEDGRILPNDYRQFVWGYAVTSYAAQGKTADYVIFSDAAIRAATNQKQWYVTISRGRKGIHIFTTDKQQLRENIAGSGNRQLAMELVAQGRRQAQAQRLQFSP
jgi:ATP-dependent exoDNAse (exonuclease V) alpha subunit